VLFWRPMLIRTAISRYLHESDRNIMTTHDLSLLLFTLMEKGEYKGERLNIKRTPNKKDISYYVSQLQYYGVIQEDGELSNVYQILARPKISLDEKISQADPFAVISYLSAMQYHGITDRRSSIVYYRTANLQTRKAAIHDSLSKALGEYEYDKYIKSGMPSMTIFHPKKPNLVHSVHSSSIEKHYVLSHGKGKVASIASCFLQMLQKPEFCGGIYHVIDVFEEYSEVYLNLIVNFIDRHGTSIDKVRAGYILDERLKLRHEVIENWVQYSQRGGSRKLDSTAAYQPKYSEKWALSINI